MAEWTFSGGAAERVRAAAAALRHRPGVLVTGPAGSGRTRFARELLAATAERHGPGAWVTATAAGATVPLGAFAALSASAEVTAAAEQVAARCRGVLAVDDAHLLDPASLALVHRLVATRAVPVIVTARTAGPLVDLWKDGRLERVDVDVPAPAQLHELLEAGLGDQVESGTAARLHELTGGDLALVRSLVADETAAGRLRRVAGVWLWTGEPELSPRTVDLLDAHLPVDAAACPAVEVVAARGSVRPGELDRLVGATAVETAERAGLLREQDGLVTLTVPLLGRLVRERAGTIRMRRLGAAPLPAPRPPVADAVATAAALAARGRLDAATRALRDAVAVNTADGAPTGPIQLQFAVVLGMRGDAAGAAAALALSTGCRRQHLIARAWAAAAAGAVSEAAAHARHAAVLARDDADRDAEVAALHAAVRFGDPGGAARLAALADTVPGADLAAAHAGALADDDGPALDTVARRLAERGALPAAADAVAQAAAAHHRAGARGSAIASAARAEELARRCGGAVTPALRAAARPLPLTAREREVTSLAAGGMSNKEIAARLVVSVRTVEGHLYRACAKLHVDTRAALEAVLG
ncbi:helix-turn-helix transcriptional regulator [Pseudonocardia sp. CA-107938]|uniref:helix-turn-helix transcriptional regulator n=1 Tax=Pseudonocardia sp. CA-107938 TaxID=3240021 RepID=UPI003D94EEC0